METTNAVEDNSLKATARNTSMFLTVGVLSIFLLQQMPFICIPALASFAEEYAGVPYSTIVMITTLSNIGCPFGSLFAGAIAGKKVNYKTIGIASAILTMGFGILPFFLGDNITAVLVCRFFFGFSFGLSLPISNMFIIGNFSGVGRDRMLGLSTVVANLSGVLYQLLGGFVCSFSAPATWFIHALALIPLLFILFLKEPPHPDEIAAAEARREVEHASNAMADASQSDIERGKERPMLPPSFVVICLAFSFIFMFYYPALLNNSVIISSEGLGDPSIAGLISALSGIGGLIGGALFPSLSRKLGKWFIPIFWVLLVAAIACGAFGNNVFFLGACTLVGGIAVYGNMPAILGMIAKVVPPRGQALATSVFWASFNAFGFFAGLWMAFLSTFSVSPRFASQVGFVIITIITVIWFFAVLIQGRKKRS